MSAVTTGSEVVGRETAIPRVVVTVGTDHHPFDRLIGWVNDWLEEHPGHTEAFFVQSGTASVSPDCPGADFLDTHQLNDLLDRADVLVTHGGPASIADAWSRGHVPIVVPRTRSLREHVDDHQVDFCAKVAELGHVRLARTPEDFARFIQEASRDRGGAGRPSADWEAAVARFAELTDELVSRPRRRPSLLNLARRTRRVPETSLPAGGSPAPAPGTWRSPDAPASIGLTRAPKMEGE